LSVIVASYYFHIGKVTVKACYLLPVGNIPDQPTHSYFQFINSWTHEYPPYNGYQFATSCEFRTSRYVPLQI